MIILAIESSCDDASVSIFQNKKELITLTQRQTVHSKTGGVVPEVASREHMRILIGLVSSALVASKTKLVDIDYFAVTAGPGLAGALLVGVQTARSLAFATGTPLCGINHMEGHIFSNWIDHNPQLPALVISASGGHTQLVLMKEMNKLQIIGETLDDAAGEAFDKVAKLLDLGFPGGPELARRARLGNDSSFNFPVGMSDRKSLDMSFSGLKTAALYRTQKLGNELTKKKVINDFCASFEKAVCSQIVSKVSLALHRHKVKSLLLCGGVAANERLRTELKQLAKTKKLKFSAPAMKYCGDNAAMIAMVAYFKIKSGEKPKKFSIDSVLSIK